MKDNKWPTKLKKTNTKNKARGIVLTDFKTYYKTGVIKTVLYPHKDNYIDQWNGLESPEVYCHINIQLIFNKGMRTIELVMSSLFNKWYWDKWYPHGKE